MNITIISLLELNRKSVIGRAISFTSQSVPICHQLLWFLHLGNTFQIHTLFPKASHRFSLFLLRLQQRYSNWSPLLILALVESIFHRAAKEIEEASVAL